MTEIELYVDKTAVGVSRSGILTTGMVGVPVHFAFDHSWDGLVKTAVFRGGMTERDRILDGSLKTTVPAECLLEAGSALRIGVEGRSTDGELVIPTIWGFVDTIQSGAKASGKPGEPLEHPAWAQVMALIGDMSGLSTENKETLVAAINEAFSRPGGGSDIAQPDMNAAPGEPGHILNRTHWKEIVSETTLANETGYVFNGAPYMLPSGTEITAGTECTILINGTKYTGVATEVFIPEEVAAAVGIPAGTGVALGNQSFIGLGENTGEPFLLGCMPGICMMLVALSGEVSFSITTREVIYHKIPNEYLPDSFGGDSNYIIHVSGDDDNGYFADKTAAEIYEAYLSGKICHCILNKQKMGFLGYAYLYNVMLLENSVFLRFRGSDNDSPNKCLSINIANAGDGTGEIVYVREETYDPTMSLSRLRLTIGNTNVTYNGSKDVNATIDSLKNPHALTINGQSYDGSEAVDITIDGGSAAVAMIADAGDGTFVLMEPGAETIIEKPFVFLAAQAERSLSANVLDEAGKIFRLHAVDLETRTFILSFDEGATQYRYIVHENNAITYEVIEGSSGGSVDEEAVSAIIAAAENSVKAYGAKGDGVADDTKAFQDALAANRTVTVPGGTYVLRDTLVIRENCGLTLSQDTILKFTETSNNCIEMRGSAVLRGNHAVLVAPYGLTGNVISMDTLQDGYDHKSIPPYEQQDPQWKRQRFVYDVNIIMPNSYGYNRPLADGVCSGTAIYMSATNQSGRDDDVTFMWGVVMSGVRIAGGFSRGIHAINYNSGWNHDMRIEAVIEGCEVGVELDHCNGAHLNVSIQPNVTMPGEVKYAKQGVVLRSSRYVDMMRSRVWDWHVARNDSEEYKHIALYGNCSGLLLDDFLVTEHPETDIRDEIYTDLPANFDTMTILQEPANKWFKSIDNAPYFNNGVTNRKLMLATDKFSAEQAEFIKSADGYYTHEENFTNLVTGFQNGYYLNASGGLTSDGDGKYTTTDFIPVDGAAVHTYRIGGKDISWKDAYNQCRIAWYDANKVLKGSVMSWDKVGSSIYYPQWVEDESVSAAFSTSADNAAPKGAVYFRITAKGDGADLIVTLDEKQDYNAIWHGEPKRLDESIYAQNTFLKSPNGNGFRLIVNDDGTLATEPME